MASHRLTGDVALVTGAGRGIGRAIAKALAYEGATVVLAARTVTELESVKAEIESAAGCACCGCRKALVVPADVADEASIGDLVGTVRDEFGRLDVIVNNAGFALRHTLAETTTEEWDRVMAVNVRGPFLVCREAMPLLKESGGCIVNIASVVGIKGYAGQTAYTASKHALMGMTKALAQEVQADGVRVHAVCPGGVATEMVAKTRPDLNPDVLMAPEDIADIVVFLVTRTGNAVIDEVHVRRAVSDPWF